MEQQTETMPGDEAEARRQAMRERMAKVRAARTAKLAARKAQGLPPLVEAPARRKKRKKIAKTRLDAKPAKANGPPAADNWLDGIHHMPDGCPIACRGGVCVITGENVCAHPDTNLQAKYLGGGFMEVVDRFNAARLELRRLDAERSLKK